MLLLGIDTCGTTGSVALCRVEDDSVRVLAESTMPGKTYSALLVLTIREMLEQAGATLDDLTALVVVNGPGSFTGVRVGVSAAKGLAEGTGLPVIAVSRLEVLASKTGGGPVCAAFDAGRGEFYVGFYGGDLPNREALLPRVEVLAHAGEGIRFVICDAIAAEALALVEPILVDAPTAAEAVRIALPHLAAGEFDDVVTLDANYLRRSDAEIFAKAKPAAV
jgi:tRNA threonylcarbamoyladenosine biosynthesis protein TsaB